MVKIKSIDEPTLGLHKVLLPGGRKDWIQFPWTTQSQYQEEKANCLAKFSLSIWTFILDHPRCVLSRKLPELPCCESKSFHRAMKTEKKAKDNEKINFKPHDLIALYCEFTRTMNKKKRE